MALGAATDGIALTQTGALNRAFVREVAERWAHWWRADLFGPPNRQDDLVRLCKLNSLARSPQALSLIWAVLELSSCGWRGSEVNPKTVAKIGAPTPSTP